MNFKLVSLIIMTCILGWPNVSNAQTQKVMSFNIRIDLAQDSINAWPNRKEGLTQLVKKYNPGIIAFQEVLGHQRNYIDSVLTNYTGFGMGRDGNLQSEGLPIFFDSTKFNVLQKGTFWLSESLDTASLGWDAAYPRICTYGKFISKPDSNKIWIFNLHLDNKGEKAQQEEVKLVLKKIKAWTKKEDAVIVLGDLNSIPESKPLKLLKSELTYSADISESGLKGPHGTFTGFNNTIVPDYWIDYIFCKNIKVYSYIHIDDKLPNNNCISDHLPIIMEYKIP